MYTSTATASRTNTYTQARARYVMDKVLEDFVTIAVRGFVTIERIKRWAEDVLTVLQFEAAESFEIQLTTPRGKVVGVRYLVIDDGSITEDEASGGQNLYALPDRTQAAIVISMRDGAKKRADALQYLKRRGWSMNGTVLEDEGVRDRGYSKTGFGVERKRIGDW